MRSFLYRLSIFVFFWRFILCYFCFRKCLTLMMFCPAQWHTDTRLWFLLLQDTPHNKKLEVNNKVKKKEKRNKKKEKK